MMFIILFCLLSITNILQSSGHGSYSSEFSRSSSPVTVAIPQPNNPSSDHASESFRPNLPVIVTIPQQNAATPLLRNNNQDQLAVTEHDMYYATENKNNIVNNQRYDDKYTKTMKCCCICGLIVVVIGGITCATTRNENQNTINGTNF